jgi:carboxyl-terminal processing protease
MDGKNLRKLDFIKTRSWLLLLLLLGVWSAPAGARDLQTAAVDPPAFNPLQLERKFQDAYSIIEERYIDPVQSNTVMMKGFMEMLRLPELDAIKYSDLVNPTQRLGTTRDDFQAFRQALQNIRQNAAEPVNLDDLVSAMIRGMVGGLNDSYSIYLEPEKNRELQEMLRGERKSYAGIGIQFEFRENKCHVVTPIPDSPAYRAGILPGDAIIRVDGQPLENETTATDRISGEPGSTVLLTIERENVPEPLNFEIVRETIVQPELEKILLPQEIGYIRINSFNEHSSRALLENLRYLEGMGMKKCIVDLRRNAGGLLTAAVQISDIFLPRGSLVVTTRGRAPDTLKEHRTRGNYPYTRIPLVVLVDRFTASAAEIVTGAIRDNRRGIAVGETTFGKGTVQEVKQLDDNSALKLTVAKYYTPSGVSIDHKGIVPDHQVPMDPSHLVFPTQFADPGSIEVTQLMEDKQLRKALEILGMQFPALPLATTSGS